MVRSVLAMRIEHPTGTRRPQVELVFQCHLFLNKVIDSFGKQGQLRRLRKDDYAGMRHFDTEGRQPATPSEMQFNEVTPIMRNERPTMLCSGKQVGVVTGMWHALVQSGSRSMTVTTQMTGKADRYVVVEVEGCHPWLSAVFRS